MQTTQLENFLMIIECGSINKAAQKLFMSQPTLSQQLKQLEEEVGTELFKREGRKLALTPEGKVLAEYAQKQVNSLNKTLNKIKAMKYGAKEEITIGVAHTSLIPDVGRWIGVMNEKHPEITYTFYNCNASESGKLLNGEKFDAIFTRQIYANAEFLTSCECVPIKTHGVVAILPPKLHWEKDEISLEDLDGMDVIVRNKHDKRFADKCAEYDSIPVVKGLCSNNLLKLELVKNNVGIGFFLDSIVDAALLKSYGLKCCKVKDISMLNTTYIVYPKAKKDAPAIKYLLEAIFATENEN